MRASGGSDTNNGSTWTDAVATLERAFELAGDGDTIRFAAGTYLPVHRTNPSDPRSATVWLGLGGPSGNVVIKGGYPAAGGPDDERDPDAPSQVTSFSGDLNNDDGSSEFDDNSYHVVFFEDAETNSRLDGMTVVGGNADGAHSGLTGHGGGILMTHTDAESPLDGVVQNCRVKENFAANGGGIAILSAQEIETGMHPSPTIRTTMVFDNSANREGGGIKVQGVAAEIAGCLVRDNACGLLGGGMSLYSPDGPAIRVVNCTVVRNTAGSGGSGINLDATGPKIEIDSCIVVGNPGLTETDPTQQIFGLSYTPDVVVLNYSNLAGYSTFGFSLGTGNLSHVDPLFVNPEDNCDPLDFRLEAVSPCVDVGNPDPYALPRDTYDADEDLVTDDEPLPDLDRHLRVLDALVFGSHRVDMGAYERTCRADFVAPYGTVGAPELAFLGGAWGPNPGSAADLDGDGYVGSIDQTLLLGAWGSCQQAGLGSGDSFRGGDDPELHDEVLDLLAWFGFEDVDSFVAWTDLAGPELFCALLAQYIEFAGGGS